MKDKEAGQKIYDRTNLTEYWRDYSALARRQRQAWNKQTDLDKELLQISEEHLNLILQAPEVLDSPRQRLEEYIRRNMMDARELMFQIGLIKHHDSLDRRKNE